MQGSRGSITKSGNRHIRRVLVEAAWSCRHRPYVGRLLADAPARS
ncbi:MAG: transposase [Actinobacteria bacterium]|nr:transposase [Actinomycetota bacterium]